MLWKRILKIAGAVVLLAVVVVLGYVAYVALDYSRLPDGEVLAIEGGGEGILPRDKTLTAMTYNIGYGAYSPDYSFFMDGGEHARAFSEQAVRENVAGALGLMASASPSVLLVQEVDRDADRSYHVDIDALLRAEFPDCSAVFAENYNSAYLLYPPTDPIGKSYSGIVTLSKYPVVSALRRSLPLEGGFRKFFDLDRCYSISRMPVQGGKTLHVFNVHLSAFAEDTTVTDAQIDLLAGDMTAAYAQGDYVLCGGDFNHDLTGGATALFGNVQEAPGWSLPFPAGKLPEGFRLCPPLDNASPRPSCRNVDAPYTPGETFITTVDGFIVSDNIAVEKAYIYDDSFLYSDHNPAVLTFSLQ